MDAANEVRRGLPWNFLQREQTAKKLNHKGHKIFLCGPCAFVLKKKSGGNFFETPQTRGKVLT